MPAQKLKIPNYMTVKTFAQEPLHGEEETESLPMEELVLMLMGESTGRRTGVSPLRFESKVCG